MWVVVMDSSAVVKTEQPRHAIHNPFCWLGLLIIVVSIIALVSGISVQQEMWTLVASNALLVGLLVTGAAAIFPVMLYSTLAPGNSLTAYAAASSHRALILALVWWPVALALASTYFIFISRRYAGKVGVKQDAQMFSQESATSRGIGSNSFKLRGRQRRALRNLRASRMPSRPSVRARW
jgi:cytochrome bd-type quinol oxidase subunit 2